MKDKNSLEIYIKPEAGQKFHKDIGWLELQKAGNFTVGTKSYEDEKTNLTKKFDEESAMLKKEYLSKLDRLQKDGERGEEFIHENYDDLKNNLVKSETYRANLEVYKQSVINRKKQNTTLNNNYEKDLKVLKDNNDKDLKDLKIQYQNIRWVWQLVGSKRPNLNKDSFNEKIEAGQPELHLTFDDFIEGGGGTYIEPFWDGENPIGKYPNGILVNAIGQDPKIITAEWTDAEDKEITDVLQFGSSVYLNIYTSSLYGNNLKIQLKDNDKIIRFLTFGYKNADDKLFATEYLNNDLENRTEEDVTKQGDFFERPVNAHTSYSVPSTAKKGYLVQEDDDNTDGKTTSKPNVQKAKFAVFIDPVWESLAGSELEIYPIVYNNRISKGKEELPEKILKISASSTKIITVDPSTSNQVAVLSEIETNLQHFSPCGYNTIKARIDNHEYPVFSRKISEPETELHLEVISDDKTKIAWLYMPDLNTIECTYNNVIEYHTGKVISLKDPKEHYKNLNLTATDISFDINYPKPTLKQLESYSWLPNVKPKQYNLQFNTCRFQHPLLIDVYPDLEYTFNAHLGVDEEEYLYVVQTKNYNKRDYKGKKSDGTKAAKKDHKKRVKENFKDDVDGSVKKDNYKEKYKVSVGSEYKFGDAEPIALEFEFVKTLGGIIENVMYVYDTIDSYLCGDVMKQVEQGEEFDDNGNKKILTSAQKAKNKKEYTEKQKQRKNKKKGMPKAAGFPVRLELTPPKFTGGVTYKYKTSTTKPNEIGVNYEFRLGALPLVGVEGRLDLLFAAQFIPYVGQVVKGLDKAIEAINKGGKALERLHLGTLEAEYYFDLVATAQLNIDITNGATYHTIDGFTGGHLQIDAPLSISLEAGGSIKMELISVKAEASISAAATAKFKVYFVSDKKDFMTFEFEGIEGIVKTNFNFTTKEDSEGNDKPPTPKSKDPEPVPILSGFKIDIPLFKKQIVENPHKDEE